MVDSVQTRITSAAYYELPETNEIEELIDGEIIVSPTPLDIHQRASMRILAFFVRALPDGELRHAPTGVHFEEGYDLEPDIFWISPNNEQCFLAPDGRYWHGAPDLIVEILSPSTASRDRGVKYETYEKHGVKEYWLVDPESQFIEVYCFEDSQFKRLGLFRVGQTFTSKLLNIDVPIADLIG